MTYQLTIEPLGQTIDIEAGQTVLDACLRAGVWLPHACGHGLCGTCKVQTLQGELDHGEASPFALMDFEREEAKCLACCATPVSDMVIEADIEPDPDAQCLPLTDFTAEVVRIEALTPTIKGVFLRIDGEPLQFQPGQYVNVWIGKEATPRAFSIASAPTAPRLSIWPSPRAHGLPSLKSRTFTIARRSPRTFAPSAIDSPEAIATGALYAAASNG